jgi:signal transduction histidine kinase
MIVNESKRMTQLIHDLLEYARFGRTELHKESFNMRQLVEGVIADFQPQLKDRRVVWKVGELGDVIGDPDLLRLAVTNLIDNALKYSRRCPEAHIEIDVMPDGAQERETAFYVKDDGCGFDMSMAKKLFAPFSRLHASKDYEGTGIGLANVQKIIQRHDGRIWFESAKNKGATFFFTLPKGNVH